MYVFLTMRKNYCHYEAGQVSRTVCTKKEARKDMAQRVRDHAPEKQVPVTRGRPPHRFFFCYIAFSIQKNVGNIIFCSIHKDSKKTQVSGNT